MSSYYSEKVFVKHVDVKELDNRRSNQSQSNPVLLKDTPYTKMTKLGDTFLIVKELGLH